MPFIGEVKIVSFNFPPKGFALCNGQTLPIAQNAALFSILGTTYGGDGTTNFALPNLQGRVPLHVGTNFVLGQVGGEETHTLIQGEMPQHTHAVNASSAAGDQALPTNNYWANGNAPGYSTASSASMNPAALATAVGSQPHENRSPLLVLNFVIALVGIFPSRN